MEEDRSLQRIQPVAEKLESRRLKPLLRVKEHNVLQEPEFSVGLNRELQLPHDVLPDDSRLRRSLRTQLAAGGLEAWAGKGLVRTPQLRSRLLPK